MYLYGFLWYRKDSIAQFCYSEKYISLVKVQCAMNTLKYTTNQNDEFVHVLRKVRVELLDGWMLRPD
jgi:hypothetical protein